MRVIKDQFTRYGFYLQVCVFGHVKNRTQYQMIEKSSIPSETSPLWTDPQHRRGKCCAITFIQLTETL